jgi:hypothetical protein
MTEGLTPRELAQAKKHARTRRVSNIRRRVAIGAATLTAVFSGVILARTQLNQPTESQPDQIAMVAPVSGDGDPEERGAVETILTAAAGATQALVLDEHGEDSHSDGEEEDRDDDDDQGVAEQVLNAASGAAGAVLSDSSQSSAGSSTSTPAPLVTSQS